MSDTASFAETVEAAEASPVSNANAVRRRATSVNARERQRLDTLRLIMSQPNGRAYVWHLLTICHCFASSFRANALQSAFCEGERNVGLSILADLGAMPDEMAVMHKENRDVH